MFKFHMLKSYLINCYHYKNRCPKVSFKLIFLICISTLLLMALPIEASSDSGNINDKLPPKPPKIVKSGSELDYPPFAIVRPDGTADGFSVDLLKEVIKAVGLQVYIVVAPWHELKESLRKGELDVLPLVSYSPERDLIYDFSAPYLRMSTVAIFVRKGEESIHGYADLKNKEVLVMRGDAAQEYALKTGICDNLIVTDSFDEAFLMLSKGRHDAVIIQQLVGYQLIKKLGIANVVNVKSFEETSFKPAVKKSPRKNKTAQTISADNNVANFEQKFCLAVKEGNHELLGVLNEGLAIVFANGTYDKLYNKWFTPILPTPPVPITLVLKYLLFVTVPVLLILAIAGIWFLKKEIRKKTETLTAEMVSRQSADAQYITLFNTMVDGFTLHEIIYDQNGKPLDFRVLAVNPAFEQIIGLKSSEIVGKTLREILPDRESHWIDTYIDISLTGETATFEYYLQRVKRHLNITAYQPEPMKFACIFEDITESKINREKEEHLKNQLEQAQKMEAIGTLAGGIAHDFNNILSPIIGHTEILLDDAYDIVDDNTNHRKEDIAENIKSLNEIYKAALRAKELVKQILTFSRQTPAEIKIMKMQPIIKEALKLIRSTIPTTIDIKQNIRNDCGAVKADPTQVHQIVMNLATNAFHAMEESGGVLNISLREVALDDKNAADIPSGSYACLEISDTGVGIAPELLSKIFNPFFTTKESGKGTGLGLSVVHGIVKGINGYINVYSELGKGTKFTIHLPVVESFFQEQPFNQRAVIPQGRGQILIVDDEPIVAQMEKKMLERIGYEVTSRVSSVEALEAFRINPRKFDLVITDMAMPGMAGDKLAAELIKIRADIPILLCTGFSQKISQDNADTIGIKGILMKPVIFKELADKVKELIEGDITK